MKKGISEKLFYKIGEVAEITGLEPYVLRYWEGEFNLKLTKSKNQQRLYQKKDIDQIHRILFGEILPHQKTMEHPDRRKTPGY